MRLLLVNIHIQIMSALILSVLTFTDMTSVLSFSQPRLPLLPHHHRNSATALFTSSQITSSSSSSDDSNIQEPSFPSPPITTATPTFHRTTPLPSSTYNQVLTTNTLQPIAIQLRQFYDDHFRDPRQPNAERFNWDPWYVTVGDGIRTQSESNPANDDDDDNEEEPDTTTPIDGEYKSTSSQTQYSLKRIQTSTFFDQSLYDELIENLTELGRSIGLTAITPPWTSMYTHGDMQNWHTDTNNGPMAFVVSLCEEGDFEGGETMMMRTEVLDFWRGGEDSFGRGLECGDIVRYIPTTPLGRCIAFDPRIPHGVNRVTGSQDPRKARVVIHGWFSQPETCWFGPWGNSIGNDDNNNNDNEQQQIEKASQLLDERLAPLVQTLGSGEIGRVVGYLAVRVTIDRWGCVEDVVAVCDTMQADMEDFRGTIGYNEEDQAVMEDAVSDVRLTIFEALKGLTFGDDDDDDDDDDGNDNSNEEEEIEGMESRAVVIPFAFE